MAGRTLHLIFGVVILSVALLFISGIILPKFLSQHFELNSEQSNGTLSELDTNFDVKNETVYEENVIHGIDLNSPAAKLVQYSGISYVTEERPSQFPIPVERSKRQVRDKDDDAYFAWSFNFNVSRYKNPPSEADASIKPHEGGNTKKNHLGAAIYLSGDGPKQSYNYLQKGLDSAGDFIRSVFGQKVQNLTLEGTRNIDEDTYSLKGSLIRDSYTQNSISEEVNEAKIQSTEFNRSGRFILELLGFGRTSTTKSDQSTESKMISEDPLLLSSISTSSDKSERNFNVGENTSEPVSSEINFDRSKIDFQTETLVLEPEHPTSPPPINSDETAPTNFFVNEKLEDFCMKLVHKIGESRTSLSDNDSSEKSEKNNLSPSFPLEKFDCFSLFGILEKKPKSSHVEDAFLVSIGTEFPNNASTKDEERDARIFNWPQLGFGSGRSELDTQNSENIDTFSSSDSIEDAQINTRIFDFPQFGLGSGRSGLNEEINEEKVNLSELNADNELLGEKTTIQDCISYFRQNQNINMFPKPNLMDIISDSNIEITDFSNATISPKLKEQQTQFIIDLLETSAKTCGLDTDAISSQTLQVRLDESSDFAIDKRLADVKNNIQSHTLAADLKFVNAVVTTEQEFKNIESRTEMRRNERIFGFGSGNDAVIETDLRLISSENGEDTLETSGTVGMKLRQDVDARTDFAQQTEFDCENDCFFENSIETDDCITGCHSGPLEQNIGNILQNRSSIESNSFNNFSLLHNSSNMNVFNKSVSLNLEFNNGNLTQNNLKKYNESCNCHEDDDGTNILPEDSVYTNCDDCSLRTEGMLEESSLSAEKNALRMASQTVILTTLNFENDCDDCNTKYYKPQIEIKSAESNSSKFVSVSQFASLNDTESESFGLFEFTEDWIVTDHTKETEVVSKLINPKEELEGEQNRSRIFLRPVFLTGSGDGGLFEDGKGQINLTEETSQNLSRIFLGPVFLTGSGDGNLFEEGKGQINLTEENNESPEMFNRRRGRLDDANEMDYCDDCDIDPSSIQRETVQDNLESRIGSFGESGNQNKFPTKTSNWSFPFETFSKSISDFSENILIPTEPQPRFCVSASECNSELNERCVTSTFSSICSCARAFVKNKITGKCVKKSSYKTEVKLPAERFEEDLLNPVSQRYKQKKQDADKLIFLLLKDSPELIPIVAEVTFTGFGPGSLVMGWSIVFAAENESEADIVHHLERALNAALLDETIKVMLPFNVSNAYVLSVSNTQDPCMSSELNYCHKNSHCIPNTLLPGGFECRCKEDYIDLSVNPQYPGEICEAFCLSDYCGNHGECVWAPGIGRHCVCKDWYFGDRCGISGKVVIAGFSANIFLFIILILGIVICKASRRRNGTYGRNRRRRSSGVGTHAIAAGRVSDVIAMEECVGTKMSKISHISTPLHNVPAIKVIRPTLSASSLYDDSTFDVTPSDSNERDSEQEPSLISQPVS